MTKDEFLDASVIKWNTLEEEENSPEIDYAKAIIESIQSQVGQLTIVNSDMPELTELENLSNTIVGNRNIGNLRNYANQANTILNKLPLVTDNSGIRTIERQFSERLNILEQLASDAISNSEAFISSQEDRIERLDRIEDSLNETEKRLNKHFGSLTNQIKAGEYANSATSHARSSFWLMVCAILCFLAGAVVIAYALFNAGPDPKFTALISKVLSSAILLLPGLYLARESGKQYKERIRSQRMAHELAGLDNYFADFENDEQANKVKTALALQYFGKADEIYAVKDEKLIQERFLDFLGREAK